MRGERLIVILAKAGVQKYEGFIVKYQLVTDRTTALTKLVLTAYATQSHLLAKFGVFRGGARNVSIYEDGFRVSGVTTPAVSSVVHLDNRALCFLIDSLPYINSGYGSDAIVNSIWWVKYGWRFK